MPVPGTTGTTGTGTGTDTDTGTDTGTVRSTTVLSTVIFPTYPLLYLEYNMETTKVVHTVPWYRYYADAVLLW